MPRGQDNRVTGLRIAAIGAIFAVAALAVPALAQTAPWRNVEGPLRQLTDIAAIEQLARDHPHSSNVRLALLNVYLEAEMMDAALLEIEFLAERGYRFSEAGRAALLAAFDDGTRERLEALFAAGSGPIEASVGLATVPVEAELVEALAWRGDGEALFASTIVSRALYRRAGQGPWQRVELPVAGSLGGLVYDDAEGTLWISSGVYEQTPDPESAFRGLIGYSPDDGTTITIAGPEDSTPGDIALADDGTIYASDPLGGAIYAAHEGNLTVWVGPGTFRSPQGLVPWNGGLIVSDYGYGLAFVAPDRRVWRIDTEVPALLDGIDGMWRHGDRIVAIQNGARPPRIVELKLSADGLRVAAVRELERAHPAWTEPLGGTIVGDSFVYVATGQWDRFGEGGSVREGLVPQETDLRRLPLGESAAPPR